MEGLVVEEVMGWLREWGGGIGGGRVCGGKRGRLLVKMEMMEE